MGTGATKDLGVVLSIVPLPHSKIIHLEQSRFMYLDLNAVRSIPISVWTLPPWFVPHVHVASIFQQCPRLLHPPDLQNPTSTH
jgi:hypothetical protein